MEDGTASTNENDANKTDEIGERIQDHDHTSDDAKADARGNTDKMEEFEPAIDHEQEPPNDERVTIYDINILSQMNTSQLTIDEEEQNQ